MPRGDRTGPDGAGSMTGRGLGYCAGYGEPGFTAGGRGRGFGRGYGRGAGGRGFGGYGRGYGRGYGLRSGYDVIPNVSEKTLLENDIKILKDQLSSLEKQLGDLSKRED